MAERRRRRGGGNTVPVQYDPQRGYRVTIPKALAEALRLRGAWVEIWPEGTEALRLVILREGEDAPTADP